MQPQDPNQQQPGQTPQPQQLPPTEPAAQYSYSTNYLDQISAPVKQSRTANPKFMIGLIGGLLALLVLVGGFILINSSSTPIDKATDMLLRMQTLEKVAKAQHSHLRDGQLRTINSSYTLFLANAIRDLKEPLENAGVTVSKLPKQQRDAEKSIESGLNAQFDEARLNVTLDRAYAREMNYQLEVLHSMMMSIYNSTNDSSLKQYLESTENNLAQISEGFGSFLGSK